MIAWLHAALIRLNVEIECVCRTDSLFDGIVVELLLLCSDSRRTTTTSPVVHAKVAIVTAFGEPSKDWPLTSGGSRNNPLHSSSPSEEEEPTLPV